MRYPYAYAIEWQAGPNTGVFLELVNQMAPDVPIPGKPFSFGTLAKAQATGDIVSLNTHHRHAVRVQLVPDQAATVNAIASALTKRALPKRGKITRR